MMSDTQILFDSICTGLNQLAYAHSSLSYLEVIGASLSKYADDTGIDTHLYLEATEELEERMRILEEQKKRIDELTQQIKKKYEVA